MISVTRPIIQPEPGELEPIEVDEDEGQNLLSIITTEEAMAYRLELTEEQKVAGVHSKQLFEDGGFSLCEH